MCGPHEVSDTIFGLVVVRHFCWK